MTELEIRAVVQAYADGAKNAIAAGFDGVEVCIFS
jgi:2,4-dienoyl-CoA reductase-like NADH-dependent reductase (Old Yellow Enzyme family)